MAYTLKDAVTTGLGKKYSLPIIAHFEKTNLRPLKAKKWTAKMIQDIVNGETDYPAAEISIINLIEKKQKAVAKAADKLKKLLK